MNGGFTKGMILGGVIGASIAMIRPELMDRKSRKRMMKNGRSLIRKSSGIISNVIDFVR